MFAIHELDDLFHPDDILVMNPKLWELPTPDTAMVYKFEWEHHFDSGEQILKVWLV